MEWSGACPLILHGSWLLRPSGLTGRQGGEVQHCNQDKEQTHEAIQHFRNSLCRVQLSG
jgi:hypothetical protein